MVKNKHELEYVSPRYQYTLELLAGQLCTEERFGPKPEAEVIPLFPPARHLVEYHQGNLFD